jgi:outer membrane protein
MKNRFIHTLLATAAFAAIVAPGAIAADLTDVGFMDQSAVGSLPAFASANAQLAQYRAQITSQYEAAMKGAKSDADRQRVQMEFQQKFSDKQREIVGPIFSRAQLAIASIAENKKLSVIVDKRIVVYGGVDVTKDVIGAVTSSSAIAPPSATPAPSEIGFVDQSALDSMPKLKSASDEMATFASDQRKTFSQKMKDAKTDADRQQVAKDYNKTLSDKQDQLLKPLVDQTKSATAEAAKKHNVLLVIDRADIIFGGTDITKDVQDALGK